MERERLLCSSGTKSHDVTYPEIKGEANSMEQNHREPNLEPRSERGMRELLSQKVHEYTRILNAVFMILQTSLDLIYISNKNQPLSH
jgi:hypothetical protein